jgi:hypothetical protein
MLVGAAIVVIGIAATLVRLNLLVVRWNTLLPPMVSHLWPLLLIGTGILWLLDSREARNQHSGRLMRSGERQ